LSKHPGVIALPASHSHFDDSTRIGVVRHLPAVLQEFGVDLEEALASAGLRSDIFSDPDNAIEYPRLQRLLAACERLTRCDHIAFLAARRTRLADFGLAGRAAVCGTTAGEGLREFVARFNLHVGATTVSLLTSGGFARLVYAISVRGIADARQFQLGAVAIMFNILQDLFGQQWLPVVATFATRAPSNLRPFHLFFRAPLRFDSDESAVIFERHWLDRPLPPVDPAFRSQVAAEVRERQAAILENFPAAVRRMVRKRLIIGQSGMDEVAAAFGMHRRTLDRHLGRHGVLYGELVASVKEDVARQLLRDTRLPVQRVAESLHFSSAANFATAFRRWTGMTPREYRRRSLPISPRAGSPARPAGGRRA
jgi:AraC-like DNA-binding protein